MAGSMVMLNLLFVFFIFFVFLKKKTNCRHLVFLLSLPHSNGPGKAPCLHTAFADKQKQNKF